MCGWWSQHMGGFLKCWYPTTIGFPTKNDYFGVFGGYHHLRKHPYITGIYLEPPPKHQAKAFNQKQPKSPFGFQVVYGSFLSSFFSNTAKSWFVKLRRVLSEARKKRKKTGSLTFHGLSWLFHDGTPIMVYEIIPIELGRKSSPI